MIPSDSEFPYKDPKTRALARILSTNAISPINEILVVGCGSGIEAAVLNDSLKAQVIGIDIESNFDETASKYADLRLGDATCIEFPDGHFDAVYSFHALEHIREHRQALREIRRVLRTGGVWLIGTPNRNRIAGYLGSKGVTLSQKIRWNIIDWKARLRGEFRNEDGAHAGFSAKELNSELTEVFSEARDVSLPYYLDVYASKRLAVQFLVFFRIARWTFPAVYFVGRR